MSLVSSPSRPALSVVPPATPLGVTRFGGWFGLGRQNSSLKHQIGEMVQRHYDQIPTAEEYFEQSLQKPGTNKMSRIRTFLDLLERLPAAKTAREAYKQMSWLMLALENIAHGKANAAACKDDLLKQMFKTPWVAPSEHWMSVPRAIRTKNLPGHKVIYANGHFTLLGKNGAIRIQTYRQPHQPLLNKPGADSKSVSLPISTRELDPTA